MLQRNRSDPTSVVVSVLAGGYCDVKVESVAMGCYFVRMSHTTV